MSLSAAVLDALAASGVSREQIIAAVKADIAEREAAAAAKLEAKRTGNRERQQRKRLRSNAKSRDVTLVTRDSRDEPPSGSPKDINQTPSLPPVEASEASASSPQPRAWALPVGVSFQVWQDFLKNRKRKNLPNTDTAWKTFSDDLKRISSQTGIPPPELIQRCAGKGWASINDPRDENDRRTNGLGRNQPSSDGLSPTTRAALKVFGSSDPGEQHRVPQ